MKVWNEITREERIERWENVRRVVAAIAADPHASKKHWDMSHWLYQNSCGTIGCAAGHCALDPYFQERGFKARVRPGHPGQISSRLQLWNPGDYVQWGIESSEDLEAGGKWSLYGWGDVLEDFFGYSGALSIFGNPQQRGPDVVLAEIVSYLDSLRQA